EFVYVDVEQNHDRWVNPLLVEEPTHTKARIYRNQTQWRDEYPKAEAAIESLSSSIEHMFQNMGQQSALDVVKIKESIEPMIDSVCRNPDACLWLARMKKEDDYLYEHAISVSIWAVTLGRQLGLEYRDLRNLAIGALLLDIGKLRLNIQWLNLDKVFTEEEFNAIKRHVEFSVDMLKEKPGVNVDVVKMVAEHHERFNGSGYPLGKKGTEISLFARIAAIADSYDAITSKRNHQKPVAPAVAIKILYNLRNSSFQSELVEEFIQAVGIYPAGSLVELNTGEVAIVIAEHRSRRLRPEVMVLFDREKQPLDQPKIIKLYEQHTSEDGKSLDIAASLETGAYGIDTASISIK
ncbi:MAG: HD-GYP domain-containing protein, partial [Pseudomonadota bacterium]